MAGGVAIGGRAGRPGQASRRVAVLALAVGRSVCGLCSGLACAVQCSGSCSGASRVVRN